MPYNIPVLRELSEMGVEIKCIHNDLNKLTPYVPAPIKGIEYLKKSELSQVQLKRIALDFNANVVYISDRTIWDYNQIGILYRQKGVAVISGNDTQWKGGKQWLNVLTSSFRHKRYFSHMQIAGLRQFEYAKRLGFSNDHILWPMYSADTCIFEKIELTLDRFSNAKDFLFVGRFNRVKGIKYLLDAWRDLDNRSANLHLVGNGALLDELNIPGNVIVHSFSNQFELLELAIKCRAFILPSIHEPWGVVLHEFAAAGMPIITTTACGASPHFVVNNANGYVVKPKCSGSIAEKIKQIQMASPEKLLEMGILSRELSKSISPKRVAQAMLSVINE